MRDWLNKGEFFIGIFFKFYLFFTIIFRKIDSNSSSNGNDKQKNGKDEIIDNDGKTGNNEAGNSEAGNSEAGNNETGNNENENNENQNSGDDDDNDDEDYGNFEIESEDDVDPIDWMDLSSNSTIVPEVEPFDRKWFINLSDIEQNFYGNVLSIFISQSE